MTTATARTIRALGREHGVQSSYVDVEGIRHVASVEVVAAVLRALGAIDAPADAPEALRRCRAAARARVLGSVAVAWDGVVDLALALPGSAEPETVDVVVEGEDGRVSERAVPVSAVSRRGTREHRCRLPDRLPSGVHAVHVHAGSVEASTTVVTAPTRCFEDRSRERGFGVSAPTYALRHPPDFGAGDLRGLEDLGNWVADQGGSYLATLPLLPVYLGSPFEPSPYLPVTRRHWNEALLGPGDLDRAAPVAADRHVPPIGPDGAGDLIDWRDVGRRVERHLATAVAALSATEETELRAFLAAHPDVERYAQFRAVVAETGAPPCPGAVADPGRALAVAYAQWRLRSRVAATAERLGARGVGLVLDFPVGVHPRGFDAWDAPDDHVPGVSVGAPPDAFFPGGQSWGISAVRPDAGIADGHARLATALAHHMAPAAGLRVDHVMGLHRQFWVLDGSDPAEGVYVRYPAESLWAVLSLVSHRERCRVIGEDLGTVPAATRAALARHGALATWVGQFELQPRSPSPNPPRRAFASLSTHDTPTFAGWWSAADLRAGVARGYLTDDEASTLAAERAAARDAITTAAGLPRGEADPLPVLEMLLEQLGRSRADIVVAGLDDLWGETQPQNVPGTGDEVPNWRRRYAHTVDDLRATPALARPLEGLARSRPRTPGGS